MIKTVGDFSKVLNDYNAKDWVQNSKSEISKNNPLHNNNLVNHNKVNKNFGDFLTDSLLKVNTLQKEANVAIEKLTTGQSQGLHETMLIVEQAELAFKTMNQIRQKVIDAYREVMKIQI